MKGRWEVVSKQRHGKRRITVVSANRARELLKGRVVNAAKTMRDLQEVPLRVIGVSTGDLRWSGEKRDDRKQ